MDAPVTNEQFAELSKRFDGLEHKILALPDKAEIYKATLAIHGMVWASIATTLALSMALWNILHK
jgi:hypothetical protein